MKFLLFQDSTNSPQCDTNDGWVTTQITDQWIPGDIKGYLEFANTSRSWCVKGMGDSKGYQDPCIKEAAKRITFGQGLESFAAAIIHLLSQNTGKILCR